MRLYTFSPEEDQSHRRGPASLMLLLQLSHGCEISNVGVEILVGHQLSKVSGHRFGWLEKGDGLHSKLWKQSHSCLRWHAQ